jgi:hypothetical protein
MTPLISPDGASTKSYTATTTRLRHVVITASSTAMSRSEILSSAGIAVSGAVEPLKATPVKEHDPLLDGPVGFVDGFEAKSSRSDDEDVEYSTPGPFGF